MFGPSGGGCLVLVVVAPVSQWWWSVSPEFFWPKYHIWFFLSTMVTILLTF